jgi:hypothetical protein
MLATILKNVNEKWGSTPKIVDEKMLTKNCSQHFEKY